MNYLTEFVQQNIPMLYSPVFDVAYNLQASIESGAAELQKPAYSEPRIRLLINEKDRMLEASKKDIAKAIMEPVYISEEDVGKVYQIIDEVKTFATSDFELVSAAASKFIGMPYIKDPDERETFLLNNPGIMNEYADAVSVVKTAQGLKSGEIKYSDKGIPPRAPHVIYFAYEKADPSLWAQVIAGVGIAAVGVGAAFIPVLNGLYDFAAHNNSSQGQTYNLLHDIVINDHAAPHNSNAALQHNPDASHHNLDASQHNLQATPVSDIPQCDMKYSNGSLQPNFDSPGHALSFTEKNNNSEAKVCSNDNQFYFQVKDFNDKDPSANVLHSLNFAWDGKNNGGTGPDGSADNPKDDFLWCLSVYTGHYSYQSGHSDGQKLNTVTWGDNGIWYDTSGVKLNTPKIDDTSWWDASYHFNANGHADYYYFTGHVPYSGDGNNFKPVIDPANTSGNFKINFDIQTVKPNAQCCQVIERSSPTNPHENGYLLVIDDFATVHSQPQAPPTTVTTVVSAPLTCGFPTTSTTTAISSTSSSTSTPSPVPPTAVTKTVTASPTCGFPGPTTPVPEAQNSATLGFVAALFASAAAIFVGKKMTVKNE